jgi:aspartyl/asparaginyl-tRNA synthetase
MEIKQHYHEVLSVLGDCMVTIFDEINRNCQKELAAVQSQYPFEPLKYRPLGQTLVISFPDAIKMLKADGVQIGDFDDFTYVQHRTHCFPLLSVRPSAILLVVHCLLLHPPPLPDDSQF